MSYKMTSYYDDPREEATAVNRDRIAALRLIAGLFVITLGLPERELSWTIDSCIGDLNKILREITPAHEREAGGPKSTENTE